MSRNNSDNNQPEQEEPHHKESERAQPDRDDRPLADRRDEESNPNPEPGDEIGAEHEPSETDPAARSPKSNTRDDRPEWPTRA